MRAPAQQFNRERECHEPQADDHGPERHVVGAKDIEKLRLCKRQLHGVDTQGG
jgi:hypothetical protein